MITEDYVSFETAKLLKEKGFDSIVTRSFFEHDNCYAPCDPSEVPRKDAIAIPTLQMVMKWLRKKYNIHIEPRYFPTPNIYRYVIIHSPVTIENIDSHPQYFNTYEQTCEAAIKYCLENLI